MAGEEKVAENMVPSIARKCKDCSQEYWSMLKRGGKFPRGYTICPRCGSKNTVWISSGKKLKLF